MKPQWLPWAQRMQALAQNGLTYSENPYDIERYHQLQALAAEIMATHTDLPVAESLTRFQRETGYATPKVDVRGAVFHAGKLLLVKERSDGKWTLPGGWADVGDSPAAAVVREVAEEAGFQTRATKLLALYDRDQPRYNHPPLPFHVYKLFFRCELVGDTADIDSESVITDPTNVETEAFGFFARDQLPPLSLTRVVPVQIARLFAHYDQPDLPTDFD